MNRGCFFAVSIMFLAGSALGVQSENPAASARGGPAAVTAIGGESWLAHLGRSFNDTSMGKTGRLGPGPESRASILPSIHQVQSPSASATVVLHGADLYRLNCQGCHGESGLGAPPEINSVINPVRATSATLIRERMKNSGMDIGSAEAGKLAEQAKSALLQRLHKGGENMPAFPQLNDPEIQSLLVHLKQLAGVPGRWNAPVGVRESQVRVGELIVKSTCHTCHSATGPNPEPQELLEGAIPPLNTLTERKSQSEFIRKVTQGSTVWMGTPPVLYRGRMPVFYYLTEEEAADAYLYLTMYPPTERVAPTSTVAAQIGWQPTAEEPELLGISGTGDNRRVTMPVEGKSPEVRIIAWIFAAAFALLAGGSVFTFSEFKRLSARNKRSKRIPSSFPAGVPAVVYPITQKSGLCLESRGVACSAARPAGSADANVSGTSRKDGCSGNFEVMERVSESSRAGKRNRGRG